VIGDVAAPVLGTTGAVGALTRQLGALATPLVGGALGALTAPLDGVLSQLGDLTAGLIQQVDAIIAPVTRVVGQVEGMAVPEGIPTIAIIEPNAAVIQPTGSSTYPSAGLPDTGPSPVGVWPADAGHAAATGSDSLQFANPPAAPAEEPLGADADASTVQVLRGMWPPAMRSPGVAPTHLRGGQSDDPFSPGGPNGPMSGGANSALSTSSLKDGTGDTPVSWEARVTDAFMPAWIVAPPAVRTAADEPAFSPD